MSVRGRDSNATRLPSKLPSALLRSLTHLPPVVLTALFSSFKSIVLCLLSFVGLVVWWFAWY
jgi:hypothetical protein